MDPYIGEIRMFAGNFAPVGWLLCDGQQLPIDEYDALFNLIGTTYGGDGQNTFNLPDLQSRIPIHQGNGFLLAQTGGAEEITLTQNQLPAHTHALLASQAPGSAATPAGNLFAESGSSNVYRPAPSAGALAPQTVASDGGSQPHTNLQPFLVINFILATDGLYPNPT